MAVLLLVMGGNEFFSYTQMSQRLNQSIQTREKQMAQRLPASLALPLWNMDTAISRHAGEPGNAGHGRSGNRGHH